MMSNCKFKKGSKVEVLNRREAHPSSWLCGEIISGNGHTYTVWYDHYVPEIRAAVEKVPRKIIRTCPPLLKIRWVPGDTVEVLDQSMWKAAQVLSVFSGSYYFVRLLGSSRDFGAHVEELRPRQSWQDGQWVVIGNDLEKHFNANDSREIPRDLSRGIKRRQKFETCSRAGKKIRAVEEEGSNQQLEKVDAVAHPRRMLSEKTVHVSTNNRTKISELDPMKDIADHDGAYHFVPKLELSDAGSACYPVGNRGASRHRSTHPINGSTEDLDSNSEDTETSSESESEPLPPTKKAVEAVHQQELHAYRSTLVALHASGALNWEKEIMISNLRLALNISTDEHILELRKLVPRRNDVALYCELGS